MMLRPPLSWAPISIADKQATAVTVCGDIHLRPGQEDSFTSFLDELQQQSPQHLVILGDLFDYWLDSPTFVAAYAFLFDRLRLLKQQGWLHCVLGNRELAAGPYFQAAFPGGFTCGRWMCSPLTAACASCMVIVWCTTLVTVLWWRSWARGGFAVSRPVHPLALQQQVARWLRGKSSAKNRCVAEYGPPLQLLDPRRVAAASRNTVKILAGHIHSQLQRRIRDRELTLCGHWDELWPLGDDFAAGCGAPARQALFPVMSYLTLAHL